MRRRLTYYVRKWSSDVVAGEFIMIDLTLRLGCALRAKTYGRIWAAASELRQATSIEIVGIRANLNDYRDSQDKHKAYRPWRPRRH
jgi:hypothetical protein